MNFEEHLAFPLFLVLIELFPSPEPIGRFITKNVGHWSHIRVEELVADVAKQQRLAARKREESGGGLRKHSARTRTLSDETYNGEDEAAAAAAGDGAVRLEQQLESMPEGGAHGVRRAAAARPKTRLNLHGGPLEPNRAQEGRVRSESQEKKGEKRVIYYRERGEYERLRANKKYIYTPITKR
jgi:hypothetical protein